MPYSLPVKAWIHLVILVTFGFHLSIQHPALSSTALAKVLTSYMSTRRATTPFSTSNSLLVVRSNRPKVDLAKVVWHQPRPGQQALMVLAEVHSVNLTTIRLEHNKHTKARRREEGVSLICSRDFWFLGEIKGLHALVCGVQGTPMFLSQRLNKRFVPFSYDAR